ncbi:MAG: flavodoxin family protein, partial [Tissierellia bacterium]|nr:flavodoxin family protein [Tissierellia bacterium]
GTFGVYEDIPYSHIMIVHCVKLIREKGNRVHGSFICMGALDQKRLQEKIEHPENFSHPITEEKLIRSQVFADYPTEKEIAVCGERFTNRLLVLKRLGKIK